jgi:hypothetical protein
MLTRLCRNRRTHDARSSLKRPDPLDTSPPGIEFRNLAASECVLMPE